MKEIYLSESVINELFENNSASQLTENKVQKIVPIKGKNYVCFASCSSGVGGIEWVLIQECTIAELYKGFRYNYFEKSRLIKKGKIERGNNEGQEFIYKNQKLVFIDEPIQACPIAEPKQLDLF